VVDEQTDDARVRTALLRGIRRGTWEVGTRLPSESELCATLDANRGQLRRVLAGLRADGIVAGGRGRPPVVRSTVPVRAFETFVPFSRWAESIGQVPGQRTLEVVRRPAQEGEARMLGIAVETPVVAVTRVRSLDDRPAMLERSCFPVESGRTLLHADLDQGSVHDRLIAAGVRLVTARHLIDAVAASGLEAETLGVETGSPILRERRVVRDDRGVAVEFADERYRPEAARFSIEHPVLALGREAASASPTMDA